MSESENKTLFFNPKCITEKSSPDHKRATSLVLKRADVVVLFIRSEIISVKFSSFASACYLCLYFFAIFFLSGLYSSQTDAYFHMK